MPQRVVLVMGADPGERNEVDGHDPTEHYGINEEITRKDLAEKISEIYGPILSSMKLAGELFGETTFTEDPIRRRFCISPYYSALIVLGQWLLAFIGVTSHFYEGYSSSPSFFFLLVTTIWYVQCASCATICLLMLPLTFNRQSRLALFLSSLLKTRSDLEGLRPKALKDLMFACAVSVFNSVVAVLFSIYFNGIVSVFKPWDHHLAIRVIEIFFAILNSFVWTLPVLLFCVTCLVLEMMFETLKRKANDLTIAKLRQEYLKLCEVVDLANKVFSTLVFVIVALNIPLICINIYQLIKSVRKKSSEEADVMFIVSYLYWSVCLLCLTAVLCIFGDRVNKKAHSFYETLQKWPVSGQDVKETSELMLFLAHIQGEPIGLSVGGLSVINKSFLLTLVGIIVSYFVVLITLPI